MATRLGDGGDDLTIGSLDQPVPLKFLPANVAADPARLARFPNELRVARQVSHKNVGRLNERKRVGSRFSAS